MAQELEKRSLTLVRGGLRGARAARVYNVCSWMLTTALGWSAGSDLAERHRAAHPLFSQVRQT